MRRWGVVLREPMVVRRGDPGDTAKARSGGPRRGQWPSPSSSFHEVVTEHILRTGTLLGTTGEGMTRTDETLTSLYSHTMRG